MSADDRDLPDFSGSGSSESAAPEDRPSVFSAGDRIDDFEIIEEVGRGGMGIVYKAFELSLKRVVALKVLSPRISGNPSLAKRFRREAVLAANLAHPNIVPVHHIDQNTPPRYFTMEFVQGCSVRDKVKKEGYLRPPEAVRIALQACDALHYAHERNILHRDVKPSNILLQNHLERVRVTDFGIAQDVTGALAEVTETEGTTAGTPEFMSPEQNLGEKLDRRTDVFSLGTTLYYMLTGRTAYEVKNRAGLALAFEKQSPLPPSRLNSQATEELDRIVLKMIAVDRDQRYPDCAAAAADLVKFSGTLPAAPAPSKPRTSQARINWPIILGIACVIALFAASVVAWYWIAQRRAADKSSPSATHIEPQKPPAEAFGWPSGEAIVMTSAVDPSPYRHNDLSRALFWQGDFEVEAWVMVDSFGRMMAEPPTVGGLRLFFNGGQHVAVEITDGRFALAPGEIVTDVRAELNTWYRYRISRVGETVTCRVFDRHGAALVAQDFALGRRDLKQMVLASYNADGARTYWDEIYTPAFADHCDSLANWWHQTPGDARVNSAHTWVASPGGINK